MKKIKGYIYIFAFILMAVFMVRNNTVLAADDIDEDDALVVINPNSSGDANYKYDGVQYARARDIIVSIKISDEDLAAYDDKFEICEYIPASTADNVKEQEKCSYYLKTKKTNSFQLTGRQDGEKTVKIYFYSNYANKAKAKTVVKKIVLDTTGPIISLTGGEYIFLPKGQTYNELGATCTDDSGVVLGECKVTVGEVNIDMNKEGYQYIRYTAKDFLGNEVNVVRKIMVEMPEKESSNMYWVFAGIGIAILAAFLFLQVWKNKEKERQKNSSVL